MTCEELRDDYGAFALGIAADPERSEIAGHLARNCPVCVPGVRREIATVAAMSGAVKDTEPPARLRRRITAMVRPETKRSFGSLPWAVAAVLAVILVAVIVLPRQKPAANVAKLEQALSILNDPAAQDVTFGVPTARGRVIVSAKGVVLIAANLPKIESNRTFELWVIPSAGNPIPAGTFRSAADTSAVHVYTGPVVNASAIAVTVEPEGGSAQPTTTPFIVSRL